MVCVYEYSDAGGCGCWGEKKEESENFTSSALNRSALWRFPCTNERLGGVSTKVEGQRRPR